MRQGKLEKARSCKLFYRVPIGYVRLSSEEIILDPDPQVQSVVRLIFEKFVELGSCRKLLHYLQSHKVHIPVRSRSDSDVGQLRWHAARRDNLYAMLHHPIYAGAYAHGRIRTDVKHNSGGRQGTGQVLLPWEQWRILRKGALPAYISWEQYLDNLRRLSENQAVSDSARLPYEDASLVEDLVICAYCNRRMQMEKRVPSVLSRFSCRHCAKNNGTHRNASVDVRLVDELVSQQVLEAIQPLSLRGHLDAGMKRSGKHNRFPGPMRPRELIANSIAEGAALRVDVGEQENHAFAHKLTQAEKTAVLEGQSPSDEFALAQELQARQSYSSVWESILALATEIRALWTAPSTTFADQQIIIRQLLRKVVIDIHKHAGNAAVLLHWANGSVTHHKIARLHRPPTVLPMRVLQSPVDV